MENNTENVHEGKNEFQIALEKKIEGLRDFLNAEPKARIQPKLRATEGGIFPDVNLVLVKDDTDGNSTPEDKGADAAPTGEDPA